MNTRTVPTPPELEHLEQLEHSGPHFEGFSAPRASNEKTPEKCSRVFQVFQTPPATALLERCQALDIRLWVQDGGLQFDAPRGALDAELRAELVASKAELIDALRGAVTATDKTAAPLPAAPDPFARLRGPYRTIWRTIAWSDPGAPDLGLFGPPPASPAPPPASPSPPPLRGALAPPHLPRWEHISEDMRFLLALLGMLHCLASGFARSGEVPEEEKLCRLVGIMCRQVWGPLIKGDSTPLPDDPGIF